MAVLVEENTKDICQGFTGSQVIHRSLPATADLTKTPGNER